MSDEYIGKTIVSVSGLEIGSDEVSITFEDGSSFFMYHCQDCCENVRIIDIDDDTYRDGVGATWQGFEESSRTAKSDEVSESGTWTFYRLKTSNGLIWVRWLGESNGYYSESVSCGYRKDGESMYR